MAEVHGQVSISSLRAQAESSNLEVVTLQGIVHLTPPRQQESCRSESVREKKTESKLFRFVYLPLCTHRRDARSLPEPSLRGPTNHPDLVSDDHGVHQIIGVQLLFGPLQVHSDGTIRNALCQRDLFGRLSQCATL